MNIPDLIDGYITCQPTLPSSSSETQGQLVGTMGFSWAKVYNKSGRAPGHLLLPIQFQKRLNSLLLIGQKNIFWPISEEEQPGDSHVFLHEIVFLIDRRKSGPFNGNFFEESF